MKLETEKLSENEKKFRLLVKNSGDILVILDAQGLRKYISSAAERITGFTTGELDVPFCQLVHPDDIAHFQAIWDECINNPGEMFQVQYRHIHKTKGWVYFETVVQSYLNDPAINGIILNTRDITERKKTEDELLIFKETVDNSTDAIGISRPDGRHYYQNRALTELLGDVGKYPPSTTYVDEQTGDEVFNTIMAGGQWIGEIKMYSKERKVLDIYLRAYANKDAAGNITALAGIHTNITERKRDEAEREKLQAQLTQAQKMESIGRLAGGIAHDFNNMLSVILNQAELGLLKTSPDEPVYSKFKEIEKAAKRSANLTRQLLSFARKQAVTPDIINLNDLIGRMLTMLRQIIGEDIEVMWVPGKDIWPIKIDPTQIDQVLTNLCVNARHAISGTGRITIETENTVIDSCSPDQNTEIIPGDYVSLSVNDNGCGMDKETRFHLFEPFFTTKDIGKGTGLGLATVYGIVKQNNGLINVYSEPGMGTTIRIYLPKNTGQNELSPPKKPGIPATSGHETILLVEDEPMIMEIATSMLGEFGYTVIPASSPNEAIRLSREFPEDIHLLLTDVIMPEMNGRELSEKILSIRSGIKILFISGYTANVIAQHGVLNEGVHFIHKPFTMNDLAVKVREALDS